MHTSETTLCFYWRVNKWQEQRILCVRLMNQTSLLKCKLRMSELHTYLVRKTNVPIKRKPRSLMAICFNVNLYTRIFSIHCLYRDPLKPCFTRSLHTCTIFFFYKWTIYWSDYFFSRLYFLRPWKMVNAFMSKTFLIHLRLFYPPKICTLEYIVYSITLWKQYKLYCAMEKKSCS